MYSTYVNYTNARLPGSAGSRGPKPQASRLERTAPIVDTTMMSSRPLPFQDLSNSPLPPLDPISKRSGRAMRRVNLMGASIGAITEESAVSTIVDAATTGSGHWTITANLDHIRRYYEDPLVRCLVDDADLVVADGMPLIWASRLAGEPLPERVSGSSMIWSICEAASAREQSIFLLGGDPGVAERAAQVLQNRYASLDVAGTACPPRGFEDSSQQLADIKHQLATTMPRIVFVALGFPKQDFLIQQLRPVLPGASFLGVGISLSYVTGDVVRAPLWTRQVGLEWAYRLSQEPFRLGRRYLINGVPFALRLLVSAARQRTHTTTT
jgi:N-acetylglucosaminyldiphosphoundecaprenol N-acetyl-beta-D-mannosaminyltransferase